MQRDLACHLIGAANVAYSIGADGGIRSSPFYDRMGFLGEPRVIQRGPDTIDACLVGQTAHGLIVAMRGTLPLVFKPPSEFHKSLKDWVVDLEMELVEREGIPGRVHKGFSEAVLDIWTPLMDEIRSQWTPGRPLYVTGHSKGAAMALLVAIRMVRLEQITPDAVYAFATTRVGDGDFAASYDSTLPKSFRFANRDDVIPHLPPHPAFLKIARILRLGILKHFGGLMDYVHTKTLIFISWNGALIDTADLSRAGRARLATKRSFHLAWMLITGRFETVLAEHHPDTGYLDSICPDRR